MAVYRVIFHLDEPSKGRADLVLGNIENLLADLGDDDVVIELLANGGGVRALVRGPDDRTEQVEQLAARGVRFVACAHSLHTLEIPEGTFLAPVTVVPAGVGELVRKQAEGWAYIRP